MSFNQAPRGEQDEGASAVAIPGSGRQRRRAGLALIATAAALLVSVLAGCGQKGPLTLPKPVDTTADPARKPAKP